MNRYIVQYYSKTLVALADREKQQTFPLPEWTFNYPKLPNYELTIALSDRVKKTDNVNLHTGLNIVADIKAESEEEARETSKNFVETLLNLISFSTLAYCDSAILVSVINIIEDEEACPFKYYVYPFEEQEIIGSLILIDEITFRATLETYEKNSHKGRILRALSWLRKGIGEENTVNEFISYWVGLEVIKHILNGNTSEWDRVKDIFINRLHFHNFSTIKRAGRNGLLHGFRELNNKFIEEIGSYLEPVRKTLIYCIGSILGLEDSITLAITSKPPRRIRQNHWTVMKGNLENLPRDFNELIKNYPTLDAKIINKQFSIDQEGHLTMKLKVTHHFRGPSAIRWELREIEQWAKKGTGIQKISLGEINVDKAKKLSSD